MIVSHVSFFHENINDMDFLLYQEGGLLLS